ncbi:MAG: hypothetical protein A07HR67_00980 [uncultured archaeon A07HR67]|nr:MAG: hypothetical protein A07HR67_00980 [uncultured archaeon A07HR67]
MSVGCDFRIYKPGLDESTDNEWIIQAHHSS